MNGINLYHRPTPYHTQGTNLYRVLQIEKSNTEQLLLKKNRSNKNPVNWAKVEMGEIF